MGSSVSTAELRDEESLPLRSGTLRCRVSQVEKLAVERRGGARLARVTDLRLAPVAPGVATFQNVTRTPNCSVRGSPTAVTVLKVATGDDGYDPVPNVVLRATGLTRLVRLNA